jgi:tRNA (guanine-N7-)-methyltransferase
MSQARYNATYYQATQVESCIINLKAGTETNFRDITPPIDWRMFFENENPVEIEVGCGKGRFLLEASNRYRETNFVGIEKAPKYIQQTKERLLKHNATKVLIVWSDATYFVDRYVASHSVKAYHVYFPDPWPKKRQHKRRIFNNELWIKGLIRTLNPDGGRIYIATDYATYFHEIHDKLAQSPHLVYLPPNAVDRKHIPTNFELKYIKEGRKIYRTVYEVHKR